MSQEKITRAHEFAPNYKFVITNFEDKVIDITVLVQSFNIYEDLFKNVTSCDIVISDAMGLIDGLPIVGDEYVTLSYRSAGFKTAKENTDSTEPLKDLDPEAPGTQIEFENRIRSFRVYKIGKRVESAERQQNYVLHCVDDHMLLNEMMDINQSFVGQNCIEAARDLWKSNFVDTDEDFRPYNKLPKLYGIGTNDVTKSKNSSSYIAPGLTPFEVITYLKEEAQHEVSTNVSDYVFYQDLFGFHLTTITELKNREPVASFYVQDPGVEPKSAPTFTDDGESYPLMLRTIVSYDVKKTFDTVNNLGIGLYGNRVAAIDLLTKRFDEKTFSYIESADQLSPMDVGRINSADTFFKNSGSTHTRYITSELSTSSVPTGEATQFNLSKQYEKANEYLYPVDGGDKESGTIKNSEANDRLSDIKSGDPKVANPRVKHELLNRRISGKAILDNIMISFIVPGNSDLTVGQTIYVYLPQNLGDPKNTRYQLLFGTGKPGEQQHVPKFLITSLRQTYQQGQSSYNTVISAIKDSYGDRVEVIREKSLQTKEESRT
jgi:hypothetical protein